MRASPALLLALSLTACGPRAEPLDLPEDPAAPGVPVGVTTVTTSDVTMEIWYPAPDDTEGSGDEVDFRSFVPDNFVERIGEFDLPVIPTPAVRGADLRVPEEPYPVVVFSHGFGGNRLQSVDITVHLASRGYVVVGLDHPGRMIGDLLPCLFSPPLEGCTLATDDPAPEHIDAAVTWLRAASTEGDGFFEGALDMESLGLTGHSAGGFSTTDVGERQTRFDALLPTASGGVVTRDVPLLSMAGTCDSIVTYEETSADFDAGDTGQLLSIAGAGHLAFSDICTLALGDFFDDYLADRTDLSEAFADGLRQFAADGCPDGVPAVTREECATAFLPVEASNPIIRHYTTVFFDEHLKGEGDGAVDGVFPEASLR